ncbi:MAG TPA: PEP-CTERM sorting domain-containing protein [Verrucomicrobiae bacterium]|nr:PEP-CTERM sorting domain-containing protein [Verrucomicrobiae bacterium]
MNFEAAHNIPVFDPRGHAWSMPAVDALPGWTCYLGQDQIGWAWYEDVALDSAAVGIVSNTNGFVPAGFPVGGRYAVSLEFGLWPTTGVSAPASIAQSGQISSDARSIIFRGTYGFVVSFQGTTIPLAVLSTLNSDHHIYGADITQFAGQTGELRITSYAHFNYLDDITFSSQPVPEPQSTALGLLGLVGLALWRSAKRRRIAE